LAIFIDDFLPPTPRNRTWRCPPPWKSSHHETLSQIISVGNTARVSKPPSSSLTTPCKLPFAGILDPTLAENGDKTRLPQHLEPLSNNPCSKKLVTKDMKRYSNHMANPN
jgi:hypothetical protein